MVHFTIKTIMENPPWLLLTLLSAFLTALLLSKITKTRKVQTQKLPPGPKPWPIIGNLNHIGSIPHQSLHHLSQKYGEIMLLKLGKVPVVIASSPKMAEQFLKVHDAVFASRPAFAAGEHISYNYSDVSFARNGPYWRGARKIIASEFLNAKKLEKLERIRVEDRNGFLSRLQTLAGKPVVLRDELSRYSVSTIWKMLFRGKSIVDMVELREMMDEWIALTGAFNVGDWIPWLSFLDIQGYVKRMKALRRRMDRFYDYVIDDHVVGKDSGDGEDEKDFVDALLQMAEDPNPGIEITRDRIKALTMNLLLGGTNPSAITIEWAIQEVMRQPRIMKKAKEELDTVIGRNRWVEENDFTQLPYINAIIMETFRSHPLATMLAPRYALHDCNVAGYDISKETIVLINAWSIGKDPNSWDNPEEFLPERFMGREMDMIGSNFALLPFGSGRRICPGYNLGLKIVRTTLANLLHGFDLKLVQGMSPQDVSMEEKYGISTYPKHPLSIIFQPTLPPHLYFD